MDVGGSIAEMTEIDRIRDQIERAFDGDPWCGPSLMSVLEGISTNQAARRLPRLSHSIWEVVLHVAAWQEAVARRVDGEPVAMPEGGDWPTVDDAGDPAWQAALQRLGDSHRLLIRTLDSIDESHLDRKVGDSRDPAMGSGLTAYANLHGIAQHAMYHAGQIAIPKKLVGI
jgi:uncharacterized damage-inducible protein DinB